MFYLITITRNGQVYYVISPKYGVYELSATRERNTYLWLSRESAEADTRWKHLVQEGDVVTCTHTYQY